MYNILSSMHIKLYDVIPSLKQPHSLLNQPHPVINYLNTVN